MNTELQNTVLPRTTSLARSENSASLNLLGKRRQRFAPPAITPPSTPPADCRSGKIARLAQSTRSMVNQMLDNGLPYHFLIDEKPEAGETLDPQSLNNLEEGASEEDLQVQALADHAQARMETAADLVRELGDADLTRIHQACHLLAALQVFEAIREHGVDALHKLLLDDPAKYLNLLNTLCNLSNAGIKLDQHHRALADKLPLAS